MRKLTRKVTLREKKLKYGRRSLYLDIYPPYFNPHTGKHSRREFLNIHIYDNPKCASEKEYNKVSRAKANVIRAERALEFLNDHFELTDRSAAKKDFLAYFDLKAKERQQSSGNYGNWISAYNHLKLFTRGRCTFGQVDENFCKAFKEYLSVASSIKSPTPLSINSQISYFNKFKAACKEAAQEKLFASDPSEYVKAIQPEESQREFLTIEELKKLYETPCHPLVLKRAAIFSALTGLRWSDIQKLTWQEVQHSELEGYFIRFRQQKTKGAETLPISEQAYEQMGERQAPHLQVFQGLKYSAQNNLKLAQWVMQAGITKKITFHCFRHTFATLQLSFGTDLYTVSKMLGHKSIKTTEIYTKVIDQKKKEAIQRIRL